MTATLQIVKAVGASPSETVVTELQFGSKDMVNPVVPLDPDFNPIIRPGASTTPSYWVHAGLKMSSTFTDIRNIDIYFDVPVWNWGTGGALKMGVRDSGDHGCPSGSYEQAAGVVGDHGYAIEDGTNGHDYYKSQTEKVRSCSEIEGVGEKVRLDSGPYGAATTSKYAVLQVLIGSDATPEDMADGSVTIRAQVVN